MLTAGENFSHYKIISSIGAGGMGEVYLAEDTKLDRQVALKVLLDEVAEDEDRVRRFMQEAKASSALNHPNILTIYEIGEFEHSRYIATELIKGKTLRERAKGGRLTLRESLKIVLQVGAALCAAHEAGIIHRDIKPENIMIRDDGLVKVLDFGLAKLWAATTGSQVATLQQFNTEPGTLIGTAAYMSPEQARGRKLDPRSDIFSFGIVMFELFTGKRPFDGEGHLDIISSILKDEAPSLRQVSPDLPRQLERILDKTLRKDRENRYQHIKDLYIDLEDLRDELQLSESLNKPLDAARLDSVIDTNRSEVKPTLTASISKTRRFTLLHAIIFALVAAGLVAAIWFFRAGSGTTSPMPGSYKVSEVASWNSAPGELVSNASFSPDGKLIAFASTKSGTKNIWVTQTASTEAIQITNDAFSNVDPIWSPKGDEIAYFSDRGNPSGGNASLTGVWRVPALGGTPRLVGSVSARGIELKRWNESGKIYYQLNKELYAMDISSGQSQKVTSLGQSGVRWINISADEKSIAYSRRNGSDWQILVGDISGEGVKEVAKGTGEIGDGIVWLPEKNRLFYSVAIDGVQQVVVTNTGSQRNARITASETDNTVVDVSPNGQSIIIGSAKEESNLWRVTVADGQESPVSSDLTAKLWPSVSPDNQKIAFQSIKNLSGGNKILEGDIVVKTVRARDDGEKPTLLVERGFYPAWSPDGSTLAFMRKDAGKAALYSINPNGGGERRLTTGGSPIIGYSISPYNYIQAYAFTWSPDSTRIAYVSNSNGASNIWTVGLRENSDAALTTNVDPDLAIYCPLWSTDGKRLAFYYEKLSKDNGKSIRGLKVLDIATGESNTVVESAETMRLIGWTADETGLIAAIPDKVSGLPPATVLKRIAIAGGAETVIADLKNIYFYNIFLSDDRKFIAYAARTENKDDIWVIASAGGVARKVTSNNDSGLYYSRLAWLHDESSIVFGKQTRYSLLSIITDIN